MGRNLDPPRPDPLRRSTVHDDPTPRDDEQLRRHAAAEARDRAAEQRDHDADELDGGTGPDAEHRLQAAIDRLHAARDRDDDA